MTEEVNSTENTEETTPREYTAIEQRAMEMGWRPQEEWQGEEDAFIDAREFVNRQPLFDKIEHQSKELREMRKAFDAFKTHHSKVKEAEYNRAMADLKAARRRALQDGETDHALLLEDKIEEISSEKEAFDKSAEQTRTPAETVNPQFAQWTQKNTWYGKDAAMTAYADRIGVELHQKGLNPESVLHEIDREIRKEFKHKFENQRRSTGNAVESGTRQSGKGSTEFALTDDERRVMNKLVAQEVMTKEQYIEEIKRTRG